MTPGLALLVLLQSAGPATTTATTVEVLPNRLAAVVLPTVRPADADAEPSDARLVAFSDELLDAAEEMFEWRRIRVTSKAELDKALEAMELEGPCADAACSAAVARRVRATHAVRGELLGTPGGPCVARVELYDRLVNDTTRRLERKIEPCSDDNLLGAAADLGRQIADGPRAPVEVTLELTRLDVPTLDVPDIADVSPYVTSTVAKDRKAFDLDRALEVYTAKHMVVFEDDARPNTYFIARDRRLLTECDARRAASAELPENIREFCDGNDWEWAWLGVPIGGLLSWVSLGSFQEGEFLGVLTFATGTVTALTSAALAILLNENAKDPEDAEYYSDRAAIEEIVERNNRELRRTLELTDAEVGVAGLGL